MNRFTTMYSDMSEDRRLFLRDLGLQPAYRELVKDVINEVNQDRDNLQPDWDHPQQVNSTLTKLKAETDILENLLELMETIQKSVTQESNER